MEELIPRSLGPERRRALERVLSAEPALADELAMIAPQLGEARRERFWAALARAWAEAEAGGSPTGGRRAAAAVLAALELAARGPTGGGGRLPAAREAAPPPGSGGVGPESGTGG